MKERSDRQKKTNSVQKKLFIKLGFILILIVLLMIPQTLVQGLIGERKYRLFSVKEDISHSWGGVQTITGPVITVPYTKKVLQNNQWVEVENQFFIMPENLSIISDLKTETKNRSIYEILIYTAQVDMQAAFEIPDLSAMDRDVIEILYDEARINIEVTDPKALNDGVYFTSNDKRYKMVMGTADKTVIGPGISVRFPLSESDNKVSIDIPISINGHEGLFFYPGGDQTDISMNADWHSPSFQGNHLPKESDITNEKFSARWKTNEYSRPSPRYWAGYAYQLTHPESTFGARLIKPADQYQQNSRSAKYALLIITLTFGIFFVFESVYKSRIHPVQYSLVGAALVLFYYLLLSISEHLGFNWAYFISSYATISLISTYAYYVLKEGKRIGILAGAMTILYGYIYVLLQLEDYALLAGAVGLFGILAIAMYLTRNVDWYSN